jgi:glucan endo-1,3-alpha-glucosidase
MALRRTEKYVFAHFMMGNTYPYQVENFQKDISDAVSCGIDGFALNLGQDEWTSSRIATFFAIVRTFPNFKLFFSFDMSIITSSSVIIDYVLQYHDHPNSFKYRGQYFVSTFAGETQSFGHDNVNSGWDIEVKRPLKERGVDICFVPSWTGVDAWEMFRKFPVVDGAFSWAAWYCHSLVILTAGHSQKKPHLQTTTAHTFRPGGQWERFIWPECRLVSLLISPGRTGFIRTWHY